MGKIFGIRLKVIGVIVVFVLLAVTWMLVYGPKGDTVSEETLVEIQSNLQDQIFQILSKRGDQITNIQFEKFWTEQVNANTVKANFVISYDEPLSDDTGRVIREGSMILTKLDETAQEQVWIADAVNVNGEQITFENGLKFRSGDDDDEAGTEEDELEAEAIPYGEEDAAGDDDTVGEEIELEVIEED